MTRYITNEFLKISIYSEDEMKELYERVVDKHEYSDYEDWIYDMLRSGIFKKITEETMENKIENIEQKIKEIIKNEYHPDRDGWIKIYRAYDNEIETETLREISKSDNPREFFEGEIHDRELDEYDYCYANEIDSSIRKKLTEEEIEIYNANYEEIRDFIRDNYYFSYDLDDFNETVKVNILLDTGNANYDFTCDSYLNWHGDGKIDKDSSILWLTKWQGKEKEFRKEMLYRYRADAELVNKDEAKGNDKFVDSCINELINIGSDLGTLTFLVNMPLFDYFKLREAMKAEEELNDSYTYENRKGTGTITISKDTMCGLFNSWTGSGSCLDIELDKDVVLPIKAIFTAEIETGKSEYGYSVDSVYGFVGSVWDGTVKETNYMNENEIKAATKEVT